MRRSEQPLVPRRRAGKTRLRKEYLESFVEMGAVAMASPCDIARAGGAHRALPMKVVWIQKPEKKNSLERNRKSNEYRVYVFYEY